jgi:hypothetical protein
MAGAPPDGSDPANPYEAAGTPLGPFSTQFETLETVLRFVVDDPQKFANNLFSAVLRLPREERFYDSRGELNEVIEAEFGSVDAFRAQMSTFDPDDFSSLMTKVWDSLLQDTVERVFFIRDATPTLIVSSTYEILKQGFNALEQLDKSDDQRAVASSCLALIARLFEGAKLEAVDEDWLHELALDIVWASTVVAQMSDHPEYADPESVSSSEAFRDAVAYGAVVVYNRLDISVSRGSELAELTVEKFEKKLESYHVQPRYGPESPESIDGKLIDE